MAYVRNTEKNSRIFLSKSKREKELKLELESLLDSWGIQGDNEREHVFQFF